MIKLKDLERVDEVEFEGAENVTLDTLKASMTDLADHNNIPMAFYTEEAKDGGLFGSTYTALVAYHPEHRRDYYNMAIILTTQGSYGNVTVFAAGKSKQMNKFARSAYNKEWRKGRSMSEKIGNAAVGALMNMGKSKQKLADEQAYYESILDILGMALFS